ncbi:EutN/CcmL family microcompartment protein [bacterium]|nr:EutN/CcmL family microcompartment protein [candidate division CSSED10-310 bacterium]
MFIGKVIGRVWATQKTPSLTGKRLLLVNRLNGSPPSETSDITLAVCDKIDAGIGDTVLVMDEGGSARSILNLKNAPIRTVIVAICDSVSIGNQNFYVSGTERDQK